MAYDPVLAERALIALSNHPAVRADELVEKRMFGGVSYMLRGAMTVGVLGEDLVVRATPGDAARYLEEPHVRPMDFTGKPMKGWLYVNAQAVDTDDALRRWVERAVAFVTSTPPPAAKKKRAQR
ncbi:MAG: TfoX/Sxy family protein [Polyangiales bacterium]